jgi:hypothetical protein
VRIRRGDAPSVGRALVARRASMLFVSGLLAAATLVLRPGIPPVQAAADSQCFTSPYCTTVTFTLSGNGEGSVVGTDGTFGAPNGTISCQRSRGTTTGTCSYEYYVGLGKTRALFYTVAPGSLSEACAPGTDSCTTSPQSLGAVIGPQETLGEGFEMRLLLPVTISVARDGDGGGKVTSTPSGIVCGSSCDSEFGLGGPVTLVAKPNASSSFVSWSAGPCQGQAATCNFIALSDATITATFGAKTSAAPTVKPTKSPRPSASSATGPTSSPTAEPAGFLSPLPVTPTATTEGPPSIAPTSPAASATPDPAGQATADAQNSSGVSDTIILAGAIVLAALIVAGGLAVSRRKVT